MQFELKIVGDSAAELLACLQGISGANPLTAPATKKAATTAPKVEAPAETSTEETGGEATEAPDFELVRTAATAKLKANKAGFVALLAEFNIPRLQALQKEQYAAFLAKVNAL